jgi:hypothetical protein
MIDKDSAHLDKAKFFANSLLWFHIGVAVSFFACRAFDVMASLCVLPVALAALILTIVKEKEEVQELA